MEQSSFPRPRNLQNTRTPGIALCFEHESATGAYLSGITPEDFKENVVLVGGPGTGKTELIKHLALGSIKDGKPVVLFDSYGWLCDDFVRALTTYDSTLSSRITVLDFSDHQHTVQYNPLDVSSLAEVPLATESIKHMFLALGYVDETSWTPVLAALTALAESNLQLKKNGHRQRFTLTHLQDFFRNALMRKQVMAYSSDALAQQFYGENGIFEVSTEDMQHAMVEKGLRCLGQIKNHPEYSLLWQVQENKVDWRQLLAPGQIVVVRTSQQAHTRLLGDALIACLLSDMQHSANGDARVFVDAGTLFTAQLADALLTDNALNMVVALDWVDEKHQQLIKRSGTHVLMDIGSPAKERVIKWAGMEDEDWRQINRYKAIVHHRGIVFEGGLLSPLIGEVSLEQATVISSSRRRFASQVDVMLPAGVKTSHLLSQTVKTAPAQEPGSQQKKTASTREQSKDKQEGSEFDQVVEDIGQAVQTGAQLVEDGIKLLGKLLKGR